MFSISLLAVRQLIATVILLGVPQPLLADNNPYAEEEWLREGVLREIEKFQRTTFAPHPEHKEILAVSAERAVSWWGILRVIHCTGDKIDWTASLPPAYQKNAGHYVLSLQWRYLDRLQLWVLEVFDSTHMGHGSLWLFALEDHELRVLLQTQAVDSHHEHAQRGQPLTEPASEVFRDGRLSVDYRVPEGAQHEAVFLTGTRVMLNDEDKELSTKSYAETWTWDSSKRIFTRILP